MSDNIKGCLWMLGGIGWFSLLAVSSREVGTSLSTFEILFFRSLVGTVLVVTICVATGRHHIFTTTRFDLHLIRNIGHFTGQNLWLHAINLIPLSLLFALEFTSPIWVIFLSALLLGERLTPIKILCAALGFLGVCVTTMPWAGTVNIGLLTALMSAFFFAISAVYTKRLTLNVDTATILFWLCVMQSIMAMPFVFWDGSVTIPDGATMIWIALIAVSGLTAHFCLTTALSLAPASLVMPIDFGRLPLIAIVGALIYAEPLKIQILLGAAIIFAANYMNVRTQKPTDHN